MAPLAESVFMPFMTDGRGVDWIGGWFGTGPERGLGLMFVLAGLLGVIVTMGVRLSRSYRQLSTALADPDSAPVG
jgi:DHA3 family multidrug efflux protein-like MFS transporter